MGQTKDGIFTQEVGVRGGDVFVNPLGFPRDQSQFLYSSRDWDGRGKTVNGGGTVITETIGEFFM